MVKKDKRTRKDGTVRTQVRVVEGYRPYPGSKTKQRTIKDFGILEEQEDPEAFMEKVFGFNENYRKENAPLRIEAPGTAKMYGPSGLRLNYGHKYLEAIYKMLGIDSFIKEHEKAHRFKGEYSPEEIFRFLIFSRILSPGSKRASCQTKDWFYGIKKDFTLPNIYRALSRFSKFDAGLQRHLDKKVKGAMGRDLSYAFFDITNYFFEIDFPRDEKDIRRRGVSKEHRLDPIVSMGLFIDENSLPVSMSIFPGNENETVALKPSIKKIKKSYNIKKVIVVADKGLNSSSNIDLVVNEGDGYLFSQQLRGTKGKRYEEKLFEKEGWVKNKDDSYRHKFFIEEYMGIGKDGKKTKRKRRVLLYWDKENESRARRKREEKLLKAARSIKNNAYAIKHGYEEYTKERIIEKNTGEYLENIKMVRSVDMEKAEKDSKYDGYFCLITSELKMDEKKMRKVYHGLWKIEDSFRVMKSDLLARPAFVWKEEHIRAHFLICFVSLLIIRIMQSKMGKNPLSAKRIARALNAANLREFKGGVIHFDDVGGAIAFKKRKDKKGRLVDALGYSSEDEIAKDYKRIQGLFGTCFYERFARVEEFNRFLKKLDLA